MQDAKTPITVKSTFESLQEAGYPRAYVTKLLPDWWDNSLFKTSAGAFQFALILKQRLGLDVSFGQDGDLAIEPRAARANFKHRANTRAEELNVAAGLGIALARLAVFATNEPYRDLPKHPLDLYELVRGRSGRPCVDFEGLLDLCWSYGIPVLFLKEMPRHTKKMAGMAVMVDGRPAILLGFGHDEQSRQLFVLAHELAHILCGHVQDNGALIDEDIAGVSEGLEGSAQVVRDDQEREADAFALQLIRNGQMEIIRQMPRTQSATTLAAASLRLARDRGIDQGHLILSYAKENDDWIRGTQALRFLFPTTGAIDVLRDRFLRNIDLSAITEESAEHLLAMQGFAE
ncbi:MAG: ImmA/IrrE family metallo-endopeptidase [Pseudomonas sp.]